MLSIRFLTIISFILTLGLNFNAFAQDETVSDGRLGIEEIIVTGTKRDISQQDVPIAVSTITEQQLENTFRNDVFALGQLAPNVTLTPQNGFNAIAGGIPQYPVHYGEMRTENVKHHDSWGEENCTQERNIP